MLRTVSTISAGLLLIGCSVSTNKLTDEELRKSAATEIAKIFPQEQAVREPITSELATRRALKFNLENRLQRLEEAYALKQVSIDSIDMLPTIAANAGYDRQSIASYSTSQNQGDPFKTGIYSRSSDQAIGTADLKVTWNILDFAVGYYNAKQSGNRAFIVEEKARRAKMDVVRQAKESFWLAYAAQILDRRVSRNLKEAEAVLKITQSGEKSGAIPAISALQQSKTMLENARQLDLLHRDLDSATITLAQMINVTPGKRFVLSGEAMAIPILPAPLSYLEEVAFVRNPLIREQKYRTHIAIIEVKRSIAQLMPSISGSAGLNYSSDSFLAVSGWNMLGVNASLSLLRLATIPQVYGLANKGVEVEEARALAVRMAVLAQLHIAYRKYKSAISQFEKASKLAEIERRLAEENRKREAAQVVSRIERVVTETNSILADMRMYRAYAELVSAFAAIQSTIGDDIGMSSSR